MNIKFCLYTTLRVLRDAINLNWIHLSNTTDNLDKLPARCLLLETKHFVNTNNAIKIERRLLFSFNWLEPFGFVLYMVIIVPSMVFSTCVQVVAVTIVMLQLAWHITLKSWSLMSSSDTVLLTSSSVFVSQFFYFTAVFKSTKLSSIPSFTVWLPVDEPKHKSPLSSSSLSLT